MIGDVPQRSPIMNGSFTERDLQLEAILTIFAILYLLSFYIVILGSTFEIVILVVTGRVRRSCLFRLFVVLRAIAV